MDYRAFIPELTDEAVEQLGKLKALYTEWNAAINVISRKDMDAFDERHVLHSLALVKAMKFAPGSDVLDVGTGGGFPGIPLAIVYPEVNFVLCDSIGKKMKVVRAVVQALGLTNVTVHHGRAEDIKGQLDFVVSRAVTRMNRFIPWVQGKIKKQSINPWTNSILALKAHDLSEELAEVGYPTERLPISEWLAQPFFETKQVVYAKLQQPLRAVA